MGASFEWRVDGEPAGKARSTDGHARIEVLQTESILEVSACVGDARKGPVRLASDARDLEFRFDIVVHPVWSEFAMKHFGAVVGIVFVLIAVVMVGVIQDPSPVQTHVILALFALGGGGFAGEIAGRVKAEMTLGTKLKVSATGAAAIFVLLYFFQPAGAGG